MSELRTYDGVRRCRLCDKWFVGPGRTTEDGHAECLDCAPARGEEVEVLRRAGYRPSGQHPTGDPHRSEERRR